MILTHPNQGMRSGLDLCLRIRNVWDPFQRARAHIIVLSKEADSLGVPVLYHFGKELLRISIWHNFIRILDGKSGIVQHATAKKELFPLLYGSLIRQDQLLLQLSV